MVQKGQWEQDGARGAMGARWCNRGHWGAMTARWIENTFFLTWPVETKVDKAGSEVQKSYIRFQFLPLRLHHQSRLLPRPVWVMMVEIASSTNF